ncbi:MAG: hypothetical protein VZR27_11480 [Acutalibacteraceae bacterium]|nr:hypothetical protein [Acutalibacteraceae bacterium]
MANNKKILATNPIEDVLKAQGMAKGEPIQQDTQNESKTAATEKPKATRKPRTPRATKQDTTAADQSKTAEPTPAGNTVATAIQYVPLFDDYGVPSKLKGAKNRRVQLLLYPETYDRAAEVATACGISLNDLVAAAISRLCDDYQNNKK